MMATIVLMRQVATFLMMKMATMITRRAMM